MPIINQVVKGGGGSAPAHYIEYSVDANGKLVNGSTVIDMTGVTDVGNYVLYSAYYKNTAISGAVDMSDLTTITGDYACQYMFFDCSGITSVDLSGLTTIIGISSCQQMFQGCYGITSVDMSSLTAITGNNACNSMFRDCPSLTTVRIGNTAAIDFGTYTTQFASMFSGCSQNIDVYAPAASQSAIEAMTGYPNFGGSGTVTWHWNTAE